MFSSPALTNMPSELPGRPDWTLDVLEQLRVPHHSLAGGSRNLSLTRFLPALGSASP